MEKKLIVGLVLIAAWIHWSPQLYYTYRSMDYGSHRCSDGFTIQWEWSWWSLKFYDIYPKCNR